jgi:hypothetical protein
MWSENSCRVCLLCRVLKGCPVISRVKDGSNEIYGDYPETMQNHTTLQELAYGSPSGPTWGGE